MGEAWLDRPKEVCKWIKNAFQPPLVMLKDPGTGEPTSNVQRMDEILHESWDKVMRKYADTPDLDLDKFVQQYSHFIEKKADMALAPITGARLRKRPKKMGVHTSMGLYWWCVADLLCPYDTLLNMLADLLTIVEATEKWPRIVARSYVSFIPKGEGMLPMQQTPLSVLSQLCRVWAGIRVEECMVWQESWAHPHAFSFRKKHGAADAAALIAMLIELHNIIQECLAGLGLDYLKCFDLIPQQVVLRVAILQGMHEGTHRALCGMYA